MGIDEKLLKMLGTDDGKGKVLIHYCCFSLITSEVGVFMFMENLSSVNCLFTSFVYFYFEFFFLSSRSCLF